MTTKTLEPVTTARKRGWSWRMFFQCLAIIIGLCMAAIVIGLSPAVGKPLYDRCLFYPVPYSTEGYANLTAGGVQPEDVYIDSQSGYKIHGLFYKPAGVEPTHVVLYNHGNMGNIAQRTYIVDKFLQRKVAVFIYDYAGYGRSEGQPSLSGIYQDSLGAYQYLINEKHFPANHIVLYGESLGTTVAGKLASNYDSAAVILENPISSIRRAGIDTIGILRLYPGFAWPKGARELDNVAGLKKKHSPLLIVAGTADRLTRIAQSDELFAAASEPKTYVRIEGAGHGDDIQTTSAEYQQALDNLFATFH